MYLLSSLKPFFWPNVFDSANVTSYLSDVHFHFKLELPRKFALKCVVRRVLSNKRWKMVAKIVILLLHIFSLFTSFWWQPYFYLCWFKVKNHNCNFLISTHFSTILILFFNLPNFRHKKSRANIWWPSGALMKLFVINKSIKSPFTNKCAVVF